MLCVCVFRFYDGFESRCSRSFRVVTGCPAALQVSAEEVEECLDVFRSVVADIAAARS